MSVEDKAVSRYWVSVSPLCPDGSTAKDQSCSGVQPDQTVNTHTNMHSVLKKKKKDQSSHTLMMSKNLANITWIYTEIFQIKPPEMSEDIYWLDWITLTDTDTHRHR